MIFVIFCHGCWVNFKSQKCIFSLWAAVLFNYLDCFGYLDCLVLDMCRRLPSCQHSRTRLHLWCSKEKEVPQPQKWTSISHAGMCPTAVQGCTAHCANTNCWLLCSSRLRLLETIRPPSWSGPPTRGRAQCCWMSTHSTVRLAEVIYC